MKTVILGGGLGTRLSEETVLRPKPMVEVGGHPILWHILNIYAAHGFKEFIIACGYKGEMIKEYFYNFRMHSSDLSIDLAAGSVEFISSRVPDWKISAVDTGLKTQTGGRIKRLASWIGNEPFMLTYGDGVGNIDIAALMKFHKASKCLATLTAVRPASRFGGLSLAGDRVETFIEKPQVGEGWINGGFMVLEPAVLQYIAGDDTLLEAGPLERLAAEGQLAAYRHEGFWQPMDTVRDRNLLESLWAQGNPPWKVW